MQSICKPLLCVWMLSLLVLRAQSPLATIEGRVVDARTANPVARAVVRLELGGTPYTEVETSPEGRFLIALQPPGSYQIRVTAKGYQPQLLTGIDLRTGSLLTIDFALRPSSDVLERGRFRTWMPQGSRVTLMVPGPDFDTSNSVSLAQPIWNTSALTPTVSESVSPLFLRELPLAGRDAYAMLTFLPSVSSDSATSRGLGYTPNGQRPSATHFLLDGQENDDSTSTGPRILLPPEAVAEYRAAVGNYSAEFGGTTGLLANAVTNSGGAVWHSRLYSYLKNEVLHANGFQQNRLGIQRQPWKELHLGANAGGPIQANTLFVFGSLERFRSRRRQDPEELELPTQNYKLFSTPSSFARSILDRFGGDVLLPAGNSSDPVRTIRVARPLSLDNSVALVRLDHTPPNSRFQSFMRVMGSRQVRPDFVWTPYREFQSALFQTAGSALLGTVFRRDAVVIESRGSFAFDDLGWDRPHPEIPTLNAGSTLLPGSPAFYAYRNRNATWQSSHSALISKGPHLIKLGAAILHRRQSSLLTAGRDGMYAYQTFIDFAADWPLQLQASTPRAGGADAPDSRRLYGLWQTSGYVQDDWRLTEKTSLYAGFRYEYLGPPQAARPETVITGTTLSNAAFGSSSEALFEPDRNNFAARIGLSHRIGGRAVLRIGSGVFYDRGFDNLWQTLRSNSFVLTTLPFNLPSSSLGRPIRTTLAANASQLFSLNFPEGALLQRNLRNPYSFNSFLSQEVQVARSTWLTFGGQTSFGRKLITTDRINRLFSVPAGVDNPLGLLNSRLGTIAYRGNQGLSSFAGMNVGLRHSAKDRAVAVQYTWSHAIDTQSEPLAGDFFNLNFSRAQFGEDRESVAAFSRQFQPRSDRGSSSFDQRHVLSLIATSPIGKGFRTAASFSVRSGLPFTVIAEGFNGLDEEVIYGRRPDLARPTEIVMNVPADGGRSLLNRQAFRSPGAGLQGSLGRNSLREPLFVGLDLSLSRTFRFRATSLERAPSLIVRADAFNALNRTNLGSPQRSLAAPDFGVAQYGRVGRSTGFPGLTPFSETPRQIQILIRLEF